MTNLPHSQPVVTIYLGATPAEVALIDDLRRCPDKHVELVSHAERNLLAFIRDGKADIAGSTARELATIAVDYAEYQARCDADEALGVRDAS